MEKSKKIKILIGLFYSISLFLFLFLLFSKFSLDEITSYKFIQSNRDYFFDLKNSNLLIISINFFYFYCFFYFYAWIWKSNSTNSADLFLANGLEQ